MRHILLPALAAGLLLGIAERGLAQDDARILVEKAIKAHGGEKNLTRFKAERAKARGVFYKGDTETPFTAESIVQLPSHFRNTTHFKDQGREVTLVQLLNGDRGWVMVNG